MSTWADIRYLGFWDVPRIFLVRHGGQLFLFDCPFDEGLDDYPETYAVYLMPELTEAELAGSWHRLAEKAVQRLGEIPVSAVQFDPTRRRQIDTAILNTLPLQPHARPG